MTGTGQDRTGISSDHSHWNRARQDSYQFRSQSLEQGKTGQFSVQITVIATGQDRTGIRSDHSDWKRGKTGKLSVQITATGTGQDRTAISSDHSHWNRARQDGYQFRPQPLDQDKTGQLSEFIRVHTQSHISYSTAHNTGKITVIGTGQDRTVFSSDHSDCNMTRQGSYQFRSQ